MAISHHWAFSPFAFLGWYSYARRRRIFRHALTAMLLSLLFYTILEFCNQGVIYILRQYPTDLLILAKTSPFANFSTNLFFPDEPILESSKERNLVLPNGTLRYTFKRYLKPGREGTVALYTDLSDNSDVVIKACYTSGRDIVPNAFYAFFKELQTFWSTEIPASSVLGGPVQLRTAAPFTDSTYVPMRDFFLVRRTRRYFHVPFLSTDEYHWHIVTPYFPDRTLKHQATTLDSPSTSALAASLLPALQFLLNTISRLHAQGYCHDDIKPDNLFPLPSPNSSVPLRILVADLGNVRETKHSYHFCSERRTRNQWRSCTLNDVRRTLKTFLWTLRAAAPDKTDWDRAFYERKEPWSCMYWAWMRQPRSAEELLRQLETDGLGGCDGMAREVDASRRALQAASRRELTCISVHLWPWEWLNLRQGWEAGMWGWWGFWREKSELAFEGGIDHFDLMP